MLAIAFHADPHLDRWAHLVHAFGVDRAFMVGGDAEGAAALAIGGQGRPVAFEGVESLEALPGQVLEGVPRVVVAPRSAIRQPGTVSLDGFYHPRHAVYLFGHNFRSNPAVTADHTVYIPTEHRGGTLYAEQAAALVLYDRRWLAGRLPDGRRAAV